MVASTSNKEIIAALKTIFYITNHCSSSYFIFLTNIRNILEKCPQLFVGTWNMDPKILPSRVIVKKLYHIVRLTSRSRFDDYN